MMTLGFLAGLRHWLFFLSISCGNIYYSCLPEKSSAGEHVDNTVGQLEKQVALCNDGEALGLD